MTIQDLDINISKILNTTKYKTPTKTERRNGVLVITEAIYMVDTEKCVEQLVELFKNTYDTTNTGKSY